MHAIIQARITGTLLSCVSALFLLGATLTQGGCSGLDADNATTVPTPEAATEPVGVVADVTAVEVSGNPGRYTFAVTVSSPDTGCEQYADWWEVVSEDGELLARRLLLHSHAGEQPFTRSGGPVRIEPDNRIVIRAHMHPTGYGGLVLIGSIEEGFTQATADLGFAPELETEPPLPEGCTF